MFDWLFEGGLTVFVLLFIAGAILLLLWWQWRSRRLLIAVGVVGALAAVYAALDAIVETPREKLVRIIEEMGQAFNRGDLNECFRPLADDFRAFNRDRAQLEAATRNAIRDFGIQNARVWDVELLEIDKDNGTAKVSFHARAENNQRIPLVLRCEADFARKNEEWRVKTIRLFERQSNVPWNPFER